MQKNTDDELTVSMSGFSVKFGYRDKEGRMVIPPIYDGAWPFVGNYAKVSVGKGKRGVIDKKGDVRVPLAYKDIKAISDDAAVVVDASTYQGIVDIKNGFQLPCIYESIAIKGRDDSGFLVCEVSDGWDRCLVTLNEHPDIDKDLATKDRMRQYAGFSIEKRIVSQKCDKCGGRLATGYYRSSPDSWAHLAGREGYLTICMDCGKWINFDCRIMN